MQVTQEGGVDALESLDGKYLYYTQWDEDGIWKVSVSGGEEIRVLDRRVRWLSWDLAEEGIYFLTSKPNPKGEEWSIELLNLQTGELAQIIKQQSAHTHAHLTVSRDGHWISYGERISADADLMLVENFR